MNGPGGGLLERWFNSGEKWAWEDDLSDQWLKGQEAWDAVIDEDDAICLRQARARDQPVTPVCSQRNPLRSIPSGSCNAAPRGRRDGGRLTRGGRAGQGARAVYASGRCGGG